MKKFASILGLILSIVLIALGVYNMLEGFTYVNSGFEFASANYSGDTASNSSFGADFYTYSYRATRYAANNVNALGNYLEKVINGASGLGVVIAGLFSLLLSLYGLGAACESKKQTELLKAIFGGMSRSSQQERELLRQIAEKKLEVVVPAPHAGE